MEKRRAELAQGEQGQGARALYQHPDDLQQQCGGQAQHQVYRHCHWRLHALRP